jgi:hypothetical protein
MADNILSAKIIADGGGFTKTLSQLQEQLKRFEAGLKKANNPESFNRINRAIAETRNRMASFQTVRDPFSALTNSTNRANQSLINFGRVVQDAPFGIIGIANNIDPLVNSFQLLRRETGSAGAAFKALGAGLLGPAGIAIGISSVTSLLIAFGGSLFGSKRAAEESEAALKEYRNTIDDVKSSVDGLSSALQFANQLGSLNIQIRGLDDLTNLREQSIAQRDFTFSLVKEKERLEKVRDEITENTKLSEKDRLDAIEANAKAIVDINKEILSSENTQRLIYAQIALQKKKDREKDGEDFEKYANDMIGKARKLASFFNRTTIREIAFDTDPRDTLQQQLDKALTFIDQVLNRRQTFSVKDAFLEFEQVDFAFKKMNFKAGAAFEDFTKAAKSISDELQKEVERLTKNNPILIRAAAIQLDIANMKKKIEADAKALEQLIQQAFTGALEGFATGIGEILAGGDIQDAFGGFVNAIGSAIQSLGQHIIGIGVAALSLKKALRFLIDKPLLAIAAGVALVAAGAALKKSLSLNMSGRRASGGGVSPFSEYLVGERGPEIFRPNTGGRIIPNNALGNFGNISGGMRVIVGGEFVLQGNRLVAAIAQTNQSQRRLT